MNKRLVVSSLVVLSVLAAACGKKENTSTAAIETHPVAGRVIAIDPPSKEITIAHGDIPNFMEAMTMPFVVKDTGLFRGIEVGDSVKGVLNIQRPDVWLDSLQFVSK